MLPLTVRPSIPCSTSVSDIPLQVRTLWSRLPDVLVLKTWTPTADRRSKRRPQAHKDVCLCEPAVTFHRAEWEKKIVTNCFTTQTLHEVNSDSKGVNSWNSYLSDSFIALFCFSKMQSNASFEPWFVCSSVLINSPARLGLTSRRFPSRSGESVTCHLHMA